MPLHDPPSTQLTATAVEIITFLASGALVGLLTFFTTVVDNVPGVGQVSLVAALLSLGLAVGLGLITIGRLIGIQYRREQLLEDDGAWKQGHQDPEGVDISERCLRLLYLLQFGFYGLGVGLLLGPVLWAVYIG